MATFLLSLGPFWNTALLYDSIIPKSGILIHLAVDVCMTAVHRLVEYYFGSGFRGIGTRVFGVGLKLLESNVRSALVSLHSSDKERLRLDSPTDPLGEATNAREVGFNEVGFDNCTIPLDQTERILSAVDEFGVGLKTSAASEHWTKHAQNWANAGVGYVLWAILVGGWAVLTLMPESKTESVNLVVDLTLSTTDSAGSDDERRTLELYCVGVNAKEDAVQCLPRRISSGKHSNDDDADPDDDGGDDNDPPPPSGSGPGLHEDDSNSIGWKFFGERFVLGYMAAGLWKVARRLKANTDESLAASVPRGDQQSYEIELDYASEWDVLRGVYKVSNSPNPFASDSELRPPPTRAPTLPSHFVHEKTTNVAVKIGPSPLALLTAASSLHSQLSELSVDQNDTDFQDVAREYRTNASGRSPQGDISGSEIVVQIEVDMNTRMKAKIISALCACLYNLMESFGLAGFLVVVAIPWVVVFLRFKFGEEDVDEEDSSMGEDELQRESAGVLDERCDLLSGAEDAEHFTLPAPHQQEEDKEETDLTYLKHRVHAITMASSAGVQDFKAEHVLKEARLDFNRNLNSTDFESNQREIELMSVGNIQRRADIDSEAVETELADVNTKESSMTMAVIHEGTAMGANFIFAPVFVGFVESGGRQSLMGQHHDLDFVNARASLLSEFEDEPADNMTTGYVENAAGFGVTAVDEIDDVLSEAESYVTAEDSEVVRNMEVDDMVCIEEPTQEMKEISHEPSSDREFMTRMDEPDKEEGLDLDDVPHVFPGSFPRVGVTFLLTPDLSLPMWSTRNHWFVFAGVQLEQPSEGQGHPLPSEPVAFGLPRSGSPMETSVPLVGRSAYLTPPQSSARTLPNSPPAVPRGRKTRLRESLMKERKRKGRLCTI